jgi:hypothetical protein
MIPEFASRDPLSPRFWDERFDKRLHALGAGQGAGALRRFVAARPAA